MASSGRTMLAKIWDQHVIARLSEDTDLLHVDRHLLHDLGGSRGLLDLKSRGLSVHNPELTFATPDHAISTARDRAGTIKIGLELLAALRTETSASGIRMFDIDEPGQGIVHVIGPELGLSLPGCLIVCGDSHTCTHGGLGALAFGIGSSELTHVLATQALIQRRPKTMRVSFEGKLPFGVTAKDLILALIGHIGAAGGTGYAVEYAGNAIRELPVEGRLTICNLSIELGAKIGMVAPDEKTFEYLRGRSYAPEGVMWEQAVRAWRELPSDVDASFDREVLIDVTKIIPQVTWGISPEHVIGVDGRIPDPQAIDDPARRAAFETALDYMGLQAGAAIAGTPVDWVFIGSCTNSRLSDLRAAAEVARGRKVAPGVRAWIVPGSETVKRDAVAEGLDKIFIDAGFEWREPGCSMCLAANGETVAPGQRSVSTSNRNFVGRQGPRARTHLASPATAAAAAIAGAIDPTCGRWSAEMPKSFDKLSAVAAPIMRGNIDTDVIIRIERLVGNSIRGTLGKWAFGALRYLPDGSENPEFILNREPYRQAEILVTGPNFGCGSSREGAVWSLQEMGIRAVIGSSFGDIFSANCFQNGILPIIVDKAIVDSLAGEIELTQGAGRVGIDLEEQTIITPTGKQIRFDIDPRRREGLLQGLDEVALTLQRDHEIRAFQASDRASRPWIHFAGKSA